MHFTKMHGCGNDYVYIDGWTQPVPVQEKLARLAVAMSDRHTGVGSDGLIVIAPSQAADATMTMLNSDGSSSEMCGNGIRCAAKLAYDAGHVRARTMRIETGAGILTVELDIDGQGSCRGATVAMGRPRLTPAEVPVSVNANGPLLELKLDVDGTARRFIAVGMGNPHAVTFVERAEDVPVARIGPLIERHALFPRGANVEFVSSLPAEGVLPVLRQRTWERGAGETQACGTGACAALVAAILDRRIQGRSAIIRLNGGDLRVAWPKDEAEVSMSGPAVTVFSGEWP